jgi:hypothetical protein
LCKKLRFTVGCSSLQNETFCKTYHKYKSLANTLTFPSGEGWIRFSEDGVVCYASRFLLLASNLLPLAAEGNISTLKNNNAPLKKQKNLKEW